jgi:uncharacterized membrane protein YkoI
MKRKLISAGVAAAGIAVGGAGAALAFGGADDTDANLTGPRADKAIAAALRATGGGAATAVERDGDEGATYEVEVRRANGSTVDVDIDGSYRVVAIDDDSEKADADDDESETGDSDD